MYFICLIQKCTRGYYKCNCNCYNSSAFCHIIHYAYTHTHSAVNNDNGRQTNGETYTTTSSSIEFEFKFGELNVIYYCTTMRHPQLVSAFLFFLFFVVVTFMRMHQSLYVSHCIPLCLFLFHVSRIFCFRLFINTSHVHIFYTKNQHFTQLHFIFVHRYLYPSIRASYRITLP